MTFGAAVAKQNHHLNSNSTGENYNYSIPSDAHFSMIQNNFNSAQANNY
jgi:hypothetical protein